MAHGAEPKTGMITAALLVCQGEDSEEIAALRPKSLMRLTFKSVASEYGATLA